MLSRMTGSAYHGFEEHATRALGPASGATGPLKRPTKKWSALEKEPQPRAVGSVRSWYWTHSRKATRRLAQDTHRSVGEHFPRFRLT
jgi:hypothetical protein